MDERFQFVLFIKRHFWITYSCCSSKWNLSGFQTFRHIKIPNIAGRRIGALLGVNTFSYTYPIQVIEGNDCRSLGIQTRLGWQLQENITKQMLPNDWIKCAAEKLRDLYSTLKETQMNLLSNHWTTWFSKSGKLKKQDKKQQKGVLYRKYFSGNTSHGKKVWSLFTVEEWDLIAE